MADDRSKVMQKADKLVRQGKLDQAISLYEQLTDASPKDMNLKNKVGDLYVRANQAEDAVRVFNQIADFYGEEGFYLKAIAMLKKIVKISPSETGCYFKLADLYAKQGLNNDAKSQYQQVADVYAKEGETAKAAESLDRILSIEPGNIKVRTRLAELQSKNGQTDKAIASYLMVGRELSSKSMHEEAAKIFEKGIGLDPAAGDLVASLGTALVAMGRHQDALDRLRLALPTNKTNVGLLAVLAEAYQGSGQRDQARQVYRQLSELEPNEVRWQERAGKAATAAAAVESAEVPDLSDLSHADYSMEELEEVSGVWAADLSPDLSSGDESEAVSREVDSDKDEFIVEHMTEAEVFIKYGLVEKAIENLEAIVGRYPNEAESLRRLKDLYLETGNKRRAAERCVELARIARTHGDAASAADLMAEARAHDPQVDVERTVGAAAAAAPAADVSGDAYSFGDAEGASVPVEMDSGPPSSGIELDFGGTSATEEQLDFDEAAESLDFSPQDEGGIDFRLEEPEAEPAAIDFDFGEAQPEPPQGDEGIEFFDEAIRVPSRADLDDGPLGMSSDAEDSIFDQETGFLDEPFDAGATSSGAGDEDSLEQIFKDFKKSVDEQLDSEDYETHYNLGIAYKEMGLIDEAISEFQLAAKDPRKLIDACSHLGLCFREKGMAKLAIKWYERALGELDPSSNQYIAILYDLGEAYEDSGDNDKALEMFMDVYGLDSGYREVADKLRKLEE